MLTPVQSRGNYGKTVQRRHKIFHKYDRSGIAIQDALYEVVYTAGQAHWTCEQIQKALGHRYGITNFTEDDLKVATAWWHDGRCGRTSKWKFVPNSDDYCPHGMYSSVYIDTNDKHTYVQILYFM